MSRILSLVVLSLLVSFAVSAFAVSAVAAEKKEAGQSKAGTIKSVDAKAKTFVLDLPARPLTFTVNEKTAINLDGKASTLEAAIKPERKATVTYTRNGDERLASKVEVKSKKAK